MESHTHAPTRSLSSPFWSPSPWCSSRGCACCFGGGKRLEDRTTAPALPASAIEVVANLDYPPGNIAVSKTGRIFFTLHPDGGPPSQVHELIDGKPVPYPDAAFQDGAPGTPHFQSILSLRIDQQDRLWVLDHANYGRGQPRIVAFDLNTNQLVHQYDFPSDVAGFLSMLNDFQVDPQGRMIYIAEASPIRQTPAIIVYDSVERKARRLLASTPVGPRRRLHHSGGGTRHDRLRLLQPAHRHRFDRPR